MSAIPQEDWFNVSAGFWRSLWLVLRGQRIREWKYLPYELADLNEVDW